MYWKAEAELLEDRLMTMAATQKLLSGNAVGLKKKKLIRLWNSILIEPGQPSAQLSKLIHPTECRKSGRPSIQ